MRYVKKWHGRPCNSSCAFCRSKHAAAYCAAVTLVLKESSKRKSASQREIWETWTLEMRRACQCHGGAQGALASVSDKGSRAQYPHSQWGERGTRGTGGAGVHLDEIFVPHGLVKRELGGDDEGG